MIAPAFTHCSTVAMSASEEFVFVRGACPWGSSLGPSWRISFTSRLLLWVSGYDYHAIVAALQHASLGVHLKAAAVVHASMAAVAVRLEDGRRLCRCTSSGSAAVVLPGSRSWSGLRHCGRRSPVECCQDQSGHSCSHTYIETDTYQHSTHCFLHLPVLTSVYEKRHDRW